MEIDLSISYVIFNTGYTHRLLGRKKKLIETIRDYEIDSTPLYIIDTIWGDGLYLLKEDIDEREIDEFIAASDKVIDARSGIVVFRVNKFIDIFPLHNILQSEINYCNMFNISNIRIFEVNILDESIKFAIVDVDTENKITCYF